MSQLIFREVLSWIMKIAGVGERNEKKIAAILGAMVKEVSFYFYFYFWDAYKCAPTWLPIKTFLF